ncbi:MAG: Flp pilus assembly protein CpaB [Solirubrobacterales bacterium]|nr:Flp pilus assembly protein CpaB [Solirubrobacterales bacterium]
MSRAVRRRRGAALLAVAIACGALAAAQVQGRVAELERSVGAPVAVVVAARDLEPGTELAAGDLRAAEVPARYAPPDAASAPAQAVGLTTAGPIAAGSPITAGVLGADVAGGGPGALRRGERAVDVRVAGGAALADAAPGTRVDVLVSTDPTDGPGRSFVALEDVELLGLGAGAPSDLAADPAATAPAATATLRVTLRQAVYLTAAEAFSGGLRLLPRPPGDRRRVGRATVGATDL